MHLTHSENVEQPQISGELSSLFNANSNEHLGRRDKLRILRVQEDENEEDVYRTVINVAKKQNVSHRERTSASVTDGPAEV